MRKLMIPLTLLLLFLFSNNSFGQQDVLTEKGGFSLNETEEHFFLFVLNNRPVDLPELRGKITKYIWKYHPTPKLKITQIQVEGELAEVPMIHIKSFPSKAAAMKFYNDLKQNRPDFLQMGMTTDYFAISKSNFEKVVRAKSLKGYKPFFAVNY
ncbi:MAG: hypothetical protein AAFZ15_24390 [Bacteroidota bacterium]